MTRITEIINKACIKKALRRIQQYSQHGVQLKASVVRALSICRKASIQFNNFFRNTFGRPIHHCRPPTLQIDGGATILPGITIGELATVGADVAVTRNVPIRAGGSTQWQAPRWPHVVDAVPSHRTCSSRAIFKTSGDARCAPNKNGQHDAGHFVVKRYAKDPRECGPPARCELKPPPSAPRLLRSRARHQSSRPARPLQPATQPPHRPDRPPRSLPCRCRN